MEPRAVRLILALGGAKRQGIHEIEIILTRGSRARRRVEKLTLGGAQSANIHVAIEVFLSRTGQYLLLVAIATSIGEPVVLDEQIVVASSRKHRSVTSCSGAAVVGFCARIGALPTCICIFAKKASHSPPISDRHLLSAFAFCSCPASPTQHLLPAPSRSEYAWECCCRIERR